MNFCIFCRESVGFGTGTHSHVHGGWQMWRPHADLACACRRPGHGPKVEQGHDCKINGASELFADGATSRKLPEIRAHQRPVTTSAAVRGQIMIIKSQRGKSPNDWMLILHAVANKNSPSRITHTRTDVRGTTHDSRHQRQSAVVQVHTQHSPQRGRRSCIV